MGSRLLRSNILQPLTEESTLNNRYDALEELSTKEELFFGCRKALKTFLDMDKILAKLILIPTNPSLQHTEQSINSIVMLKQSVQSVGPVFEALTGVRSAMLVDIRRYCAAVNLERVKTMIDIVFNEDTTFAKQPVELRHQRTYAVKSGVNGLLDVARQTYKEATMDAYDLVKGLAETHDLPLQTCYDNKRGFYIRLPATELEDRLLPPIFINVFRKKNKVECQTLDLIKGNQKISDSYNEVLIMSDKTVQDLIDGLRGHLAVLFKVSESLAVLDMICSFAQLVTTQEYVRPRLTNTLGIKCGRHPIREKLQHNRFVPNDVYATQQCRFQIVTGCNMSGKSTYIRSIALMTVMAQIGCFIPAQFASFKIIKQLFARVSIDDSIEANVSTFAAEMRETAFILRNIDQNSLAIIDELGRGTSTRDGLAIALAIAEALIESRAFVWFATHFQDLAHILSERNGVVNKHLAVDMSCTENMTMLYQLTDGVVAEQDYGLHLAKILPLPKDLLDYATHVSGKLRQQAENQKKASLAVVQARKRKLILSVKEQLVQAYNGAMVGEVLKSWLKELQREFIIRMVAIDEEAREAELDVDSEMSDAVTSTHDTEDVVTETQHGRQTSILSDQS
ncbi:hypothetical protein MBLNU459_g0052t3 [Dothideomycetes sp. NU459]